MANCLINFLTALWSFILGSLRIILFFGCILYLIIQLTWTSLLFYSLDKSDLPGFQNIDKGDFIQAFALLFVALIGCYGSFYKHHASIKFFSFANALSVIYTIFCVLIVWQKSEPPKSIERFTELMKNSMSDYDWTHQSHNTEAEAATRKWDILQTIGCCGLDNAKDWDKYRPSFVNRDDYPSSCCKRIPVASENGFCSKHDHLFEMGCVEAISWLALLEISMIIFIVTFQMFLCIIAYMIGCCDPNETHHQGVSRSQSPRLLASNNSGIPTEYRRYDGSVYIRRPPTDNYQPSAPDTKQHMTSLYPNLHDQRSPPPRYG